MNTKRIIFWSGFFIILALIIWGMIVAMNKAPVSPGKISKSPAPVTERDHIIGSSDLVTIIEYSDFQCPACQAYYFVLDRLMASSTVPFRLIYRHFPLTQHKNAMPAALASESAGVQGKFWEMYKQLFENFSDWVDLADPSKEFEEYANAIGLDMVRYRADLASSTLKDRINSDYKEGVGLGIGGTPTFFVNGKVIENPNGYEAFKTIIEQASRQSIQ